MYSDSHIRGIPSIVIVTQAAGHVDAAYAQRHSSALCLPVPPGASSWVSHDKNDAP